MAAAVLEGDRLREREVKLEVARLESEFEANRKRFARLAGLAAALEEAQVPDDIPAPRFPAEVAGVMSATVLRDNARSTLEYEIHDLSEDPTALEQVKALGYMQAPVVVTDEDHWSGARAGRRRLLHHGRRTTVDRGSSGDRRLLLPASPWRQRPPQPRRIGR